MSKLDFLSDAWFDKVISLKDGMKDMQIPDTIKSLVMNITVTGGAKPVEMCMNGGNIERGHKAGAPTTMTLPVDLAKRLFIQNDKSAGMQGFMSGQIKIQGDMSKMMAMQSVQPTADQEKLRQAIVDITNV